MAADNTVMNAGTGGETIRSLGDAGGLNWPVGVTAYPTTISAGANILQIVDQTHGFPVRLCDGSGFVATLPVSLASVPSHAVTNAGTFAVQESGAALTSLQLIDNLVLAEDAASASGDPGVQLLAVRKATPANTSGTDGDYEPLQVSAGRLWVDASGKTLTVSDATAAAALDQANVTLFTLATAAGVAGLDTKLGEIFTALQGALTVSDGGGSLTVDGSVSVSGLVPGTSATSLGKAEDAAAADGDTGVAVWAVRKDTAATTVGADGDYHPFEVDGSGRLWVNGSSVTQPVSIAAAQTLATVTTVGTVTTVTTVSTVTNLAQLGGVAVAMGTGARSAGTQRVTIATDDVVPAGQSGTWTVQPGNTANSTPWLVTDTPATSGGLSKYHVVSAASTNAANVKASAGQVYAITAFNTNASPRYLKFHNTAGTPTAGSGVTDTFLIPGNTAGAGFVINIDKGIAFGTGIGITLVTGIADADATGVGASDVVVNVYYK